MAKSVFAMQLVFLRSVTCNTDHNFKSKCSFHSSKYLYIEKGLKKVIRRLSTLRTWITSNLSKFFWGRPKNN